VYDLTLKEEVELLSIWVIDSGAKLWRGRIPVKKVRGLKTAGRTRQHTQATIDAYLRKTQDCVSGVAYLELS
jgi:hypothetical protein